MHLKRSNLAQFAGTIYMSSGRKYPKLVLDNNHYCLLSQAKDHTKWRCLFYYKTKCKAALSTSQNVVTVMYQHNHPNIAMKGDKTTIPKKVKIVRGPLIWSWVFDESYSVIEIRGVDFDFIKE